MRFDVINILKGNGFKAISIDNKIYIVSIYSLSFFQMGFDLVELTEDFNVYEWLGY